MEEEQVEAQYWLQAISSQSNCRVMIKLYKNQDNFKAIDPSRSKNMAQSTWMVLEGVWGGPQTLSSEKDHTSTTGETLYDFAGIQSRDVHINKFFWPLWLKESSNSKAYGLSIRPQ